MSNQRTPEQEASYALDYKCGRETLSPEAQVIYDKMLAERFAAAAASGQSVQAPKPLAPAIHDGLAIASLICALLWFGGLGSIAALIFGYVHDSESHRAGRAPSTLAGAGLVLGWIGLAAAIIAGIALGVHLASHSVPCDLSNPNWPNC